MPLFKAYYRLLYSSKIRKIYIIFITKVAREYNHQNVAGIALLYFALRDNDRVLEEFLRGEKIDKNKVEAAAFGTLNIVDKYFNDTPSEVRQLLNLNDKTDLLSSAKAAISKLEAITKA